MTRAQQFLMKGFSSVLSSCNDVTFTALGGSGTIESSPRVRKSKQYNGLSQPTPSSHFGLCCSGVSVGLSVVSSPRVVWLHGGVALQVPTATPAAERNESLFHSVQLWFSASSPAVSHTSYDASSISITGTACSSKERRKAHFISRQQQL